MWTAIVCTCQNTENANSFRKELLIRQRKGLLSSQTHILAVDDPRPNIGSGSATLNAIICVAEYLAAREGQKVVTADALFNARILILLLGSTFPFSPCGHAFMPDPSAVQPGTQEGGFEHTELTTNMDTFLDTLNKLCCNSPPGVWVSSTDMMLKVPSDLKPLDLSGLEDSVGVLTVLSTPEYAHRHGVCRVNEKEELDQITHNVGIDKIEPLIRPDGMCDMLSGVVYLSPRVSDTLLTLHTMPPLDACTYVGLDNGAQPLSLSLFFDMLVVLTTSITKEDYVSGRFKLSTKEQAAVTVPSGSQLHTMYESTPVHILERARTILWKVLRGIKMKAVPLPGVEHKYLRHVAADVLDRYHGNKADQEYTLINSLMAPGTHIGAGSVLINCSLPSAIGIGSNCFLSGLSESFLELQESSFLVLPLTIPDALTVQEIQVSIGSRRMRTNVSVAVVYGIHDNLVAQYTSPDASFCNKPWSTLFKRTSIQPSELWLPGTPPHNQTLFNARLFVASHTDMEVGLQETFWLAWNGGDKDRLLKWRSAWRVSLADILRCVDCKSEFKKTREISFQLQCDKMMRALRGNEAVCFLPFFRDALVDDREFEILKTLDNVVEDVEDPIIICRIYACIADMLGYMAQDGGIRGGPASNVSWRTAFSLLEKGDYQAATKALAVERANWIEGGLDRVIRASRHYEKAGQILTRKAVATAQTFISGSPCTPPAICQQVTVSAPARVDFSGAWTDTPPQAYEFGGAVVTVALTINSCYPIKSIAKRIAEPKLVLLICSGEGVVLEKVECTELSHMADYSQPHAPGALLKAAFICADIIEFPSSMPLAKQLHSRFGCGFEIQSISTLPQGSGLGTSSILGATILAALWRVAGQQHSEDSLIHAVLYLEQLLTTGGGWQDQCGGLYGGVKISRSKKGLPVSISTEPIKTPPGFLDTLSQHLLLVYTGKTRLARNLLQDVLRNWHSREAKIVHTMEDLIVNTEAAKCALENGDVAKLGACLNKTQEYKLVMAPGSMPNIVRVLIEKISPFIYGCSFPGAGGGGFITILLKSPDNKSKIKEIIETTPELGDFVLYETAVDSTGLHYSM